MGNNNTTNNNNNNNNTNTSSSQNINENNIITSKSNENNYIMNNLNININLNINTTFLHKRPTWNTSFSSVIAILRAASSKVPRNVTAIRMLTDHSIPTWLPTLPSGIVTIKSKIPAGEWFYPKQSGLHLRENASPLAMKNGQYILYFHGGAFCCCSSATHRGLLIRLASMTGASILSVDYRRPPEHPYPIPVDDCLSAYLYILEKVGDSSRIIFAGDSAGGNLVLSTLTKIIECQLPIPRAGILLSPWVDLTDIGITDSWERNSSYDYISADLAQLFAECYLGSKNLTTNTSTNIDTTIQEEIELKEDSTNIQTSLEEKEKVQEYNNNDNNNNDNTTTTIINPLQTEVESEETFLQISSSSSSSSLSSSKITFEDLSPMYSKSLHLLPPLLVEFGQCEVLYDQIMAFCEKLDNLGVDITFHAREDMVHVFPIYSFTGMQQCEDSFNKMVFFIENAFYGETGVTV